MIRSEQALDDPALLSVNGPIATITLNRPQLYNAIDIAIAIRLKELAADIETDPRIRVLVITGAGRSFCAGGDLQTMAAAIDDIVPTVTEMLTHYHTFIAALRRMPKLVLTSVHGSAAGAGLSLAFMGDFCIAAADAKFAPAYNKLGVSPDGGGTVGLVHAAGVKRALELFLAVDQFSATQAYDWGLITQVVPAPELQEATRQLAEKLARNTPAAIAATKAVIYRQAQPVEPQLEAEMNAILGCMQTDAFRSALGNFVNKSKS